VKKPKRKLARTGKHAKPAGHSGRFRDAGEADETVFRERVMRGRENESMLPEAPSQAEVSADVRRGQVVAVRGPLLVVEAETDAALADCVLRKSTRVPHRSSTAVVVGDFVSFLAKDPAPFTLTEVHPRRSQLARSRGRDEQVICANVDLGVIVASADDPPFKPRLVDRVLIAAADGGLRPVLVLNKSDRLPPGATDALLAPYAGVGVSAVAVSATKGTGLDRLEDILRDKTSVFFGQSGVGKSTIVNALIPDLDAKTGEIQAHTGKGRHTTTSSTLYRFPFGGAVVDTPGVRSFAVDPPSDASLAEFFPEIAEAAAACRFGDCRHRGDLGCAMPAAVASGRVRADRLDSYLSLRESR
jgi:ribosome biogenesis GTPase